MGSALLSISSGVLPAAPSQALFTSKYGKEYAQEVINNKEKYLDHRLLRMLTRWAFRVPMCLDERLFSLLLNLEFGSHPPTTEPLRI